MSRSRHASSVRPSRRSVSASPRAEARRQQRLAAWRKTFSRYLPFSGWRLPVAVDVAISRFRRLLGDRSAAACERLSRKLDVSLSIWRTSELEWLEQKRVFSVSVGDLDTAYVDDSWANETVGSSVSWHDASSGEDVELVYGIDAIRAGGAVNVAEGTYAEVLTTVGKPLTLRVGGGDTV